MARYQSKLDAVLQQRKRHEEAVQGEFLGMKHSLDAAEDQLRQLHKEMEAAMQEFTEQQGKGISPSEMDLYYRFLKQQYDKLEERRLAVQRLADQCERKRQDLLEATREKRWSRKSRQIGKKLISKSSGRKSRSFWMNWPAGPKGICNEAIKKRFPARFFLPFFDPLPSLRLRPIGVSPEGGGDRHQRPSPRIIGAAGDASRH